MTSLVVSFEETAETFLREAVRVTERGQYKDAVALARIASELAAMSISLRYPDLWLGEEEGEE